MIGGESARRYAKALADIADRQNSLDPIGEELSVFSNAFEGSKELQVLLKNPKFAKDKQLEMLDEVLTSSGASDLVKNFIRVLIENDRISELSAISSKYQEISDQKIGRVRAELRSAKELDPEILKKIHEKLAQVADCEVLLNVVTDKELIGGVSCKMGSVMMDGSLKNQLRNLRQDLAHK
ncbi:MAG: ATP synthase F1 subunit delta [Nitrospinota bacterium]|nr:ATP synthase F1 subunit delta [Nitrospinota bacterium]